MEKISKTKTSNFLPKNYLSCQNQQNNKFVRLHQNYNLSPTDSLYQIIQILLDLLQEKQRRKQKNKKLSDINRICHFTYYPTFQFKLRKIKPQNQICCICQQQYHQVQCQKQLQYDSQYDIISLGKCSHLFHRCCFQKLIQNNSGKWIKCPVCLSIYGIMTGDQPDDGIMNTYYDDRIKCAGYFDCGTIIITYSFKNGIKNGKNYPATSRTAYLPNNLEGNKVLRLLEKAFKNKLVFTIGKSVTTGKQNVIVWNGIHHKTALTGGSSYFGYPDTTYLKRVQEELAAKGIVEEDK